MTIKQRTTSQSIHLSRKFIIAMLLVIVLEVLTMVYFGTLKAGFHEDEYYSYFSSNRTNGFFYPDHEWVDTDDLRQEYVVMPGEGFNYSLVKLVQSWDVHPPLFYYALHTVCSLTPGIFSKWQGLAVNLFFFVILMILLAATALKVTGGNENIALLTAILYGFSPAAVSMAMFIRMYTMLTAAVLASALTLLLFYKAAREELCGGPRRPVYQYATISAVITLLGFLTQYFYLIWIFFATITLGILLFTESRKSFKAFALYCAGQAAAGILGVLHYPACLGQIFSGYRGKEAQEAFADASNIGARISTFLKLIDQYLFNSIGIVVIFVISASLLYSLYQKKEEEKAEQGAGDVSKKGPAKTSLIRDFLRDGTRLSRAGEWILLEIPVLGYFVVVAKTALLLGDSSLRYEMPILPLLMLFAVMGLDAAFRQERTLRIALTTAGMLLIGLSLYNLSQHNVLFLYEEETARIEEASQNHNQAAVVIYNPETPDNVSRLTDQLLCYDRLYYIDASDTNAIEDEVIADSDIVMVYAADSDTTDEVLSRIAECMNRSNESAKATPVSPGPESDSEDNSEAGQSFIAPAGEDNVTGEKGRLVTEEKLYHKDMWTAYKFDKR